MGGRGSGNHYRWNARDTTACANAIDIRLWHRYGALAPGQFLTARWFRGDRQVGAIGGYVESATRIVLIYRTRNRSSDEWRDMREPVEVEWTRCTYGGQRPWFRCPACQRRVALLYAPGPHYACRQCYNLAYASTREAPHYRLLSKAQDIRERLGGVANIYDLLPERPKGMHHRTYQRLKREYEWYEHASLLAAATHFDASFGALLDGIEW